MSQPRETLADAVEKDKFNAELNFAILREQFHSKSKSLKGKKVLITAGPTYEKIDDVRFIGNYSSGKMGFALALTAANLGADVILIAGPVTMASPLGIRRVDVESASEMFEATVMEFSNSDIAILAAAVADYRPANVFEGKMKKSEAGSEMTIRLVSTKDILATLGANKRNDQVLVGFALESSNEIENARKKLNEKHCDLLVLNSANKVGSGFRGDDNTITLLRKSGEIKTFQTMTKNECAEVIFDDIVELF